VQCRRVPMYSEETGLSAVCLLITVIRRLIKRGNSVVRMSEVCYAWFEAGYREMVVLSDR